MASKAAESKFGGLHFIFNINSITKEMKKSNWLGKEFGRIAVRYQKGSWSQFALECQWKTNREPAQEGRMSITITQIHNYTIAVLQKKKCKHTITQNQMQILFAFEHHWNCVSSNIFWSKIKKRGSWFFMALMGCTCWQMLSVQVVMNAPWASYLRSTWLCPCTLCT